MKFWNLHSARAHPRRIIALLLMLLVAATLTRIPDLHAQIDRLLFEASALIQQHRILGAVVFVLASAVSAMLVFFSAALLVPVGIETWGSVGCFLLLWLGWFLGGVLTYGIGRSLGRPAVDALLRKRSVSELERRLPTTHGFWGALSIQLVFPSDLGGYFFGLLRYPPGSYFAALACAELPYALGTVYLGTAFLERAWVPLVVGGALAALLLFWQWRARS
ncbi:MAG: VTT domain-containing protein [Burkholderiaceae bacterium]|nr:VTT domain-containing protein [Burkholderiaceae bacterium]